MNEITAFFIQRSDLLILIVRTILGVVMIYYGLPKVKDLHANAIDFEKMGIKPGIIFGTLVAIIEFVGGIFIILGALTNLIALAFGFEMLMGAFWKVMKAKKPFTDWSYDLILFAAMALLLIVGPGAYSLSRIF